MDTSRNDQLGDLAAEATLARTEFLAAAAAQMRTFLETNRDRIASLGGLVLIDDEVDYLAVAADLTFRSRSRYQDEATGKWVSETEILENPSDLVELYNLADVFAAFSDATTADVGLDEEHEELAPNKLKTEAAPNTLSWPAAEEGTVAAAGENPYAAVADDWAAGHEGEETPESEEEAAERLYDLALAFQERSQQTEAHLLEQFETAACQLTSVLGDLIIVAEEDERLTLRASGTFTAEVVPTEAKAGTWRKLDGPDDIVEYYDPTDIFGDLADTLAEAFPGLGGGAGPDKEDQVAVENGVDEEDAGDVVPPDGEEGEGPKEGDDRR
jgi:hypothetical protein